MFKKFSLHTLLHLQLPLLLILRLKPLIDDVVHRARDGFIDILSITETSRRLQSTEIQMSDLPVPQPLDGGNNLVGQGEGL